MKIIFTVVVFALFSHVGFSQQKSSIPKECTTCVNIVEDSITKVKIVKAQAPIQVMRKEKTEGFSLFIYRNHKEGKSANILLTSVSALTCLDKNDRLELIFEDDTKVILYNSKEANCNSVALFHLGGKMGSFEALEETMASTITKMTLISKKNEIEIEVSPELAKEIKNTLTCLMKSK